MPTPDSIDRPTDPTPPPGGSWVNAVLNGSVPGDQTVYVNPLTKQVVVTEVPTQIASLLGQGYIRAVVPGTAWSSFKQGLGNRLAYLGTNDAVGQIPIPAQASTLPPDQQQQLNAAFGDVNGAAAAQQDNLTKAYDLAQPARDRAVVKVKDAYGGMVQPTLASAAFAGAGYHQPLHTIADAARSRDATLADLNDQNLSGQFQLQVAQNNVEQQRQQQLQQAYASALNNSNSQYNNTVDAVLGWIKS